MLRKIKRIKVRTRQFRHHHCHTDCLFSQSPCSFHKLECTQSYAHCMCISVYSHLMTRNILELLMSEMAQNLCHTSANPSLSGEIDLHIPSILGLADTRVGCDTLLLLMLVVTAVVARERSLTPPCPQYC